MNARGWWLIPAAVILAAVWAQSLAAPAPPAPAATDRVAVTILHINDSHGHTEPYRLADRSVGGYARLATLVEGLRREGRAARIFLVHAGDEFSRGDELTRSTLGAANIALMNHVGFDAWVPGNGDFYDGAANLRTRMAEATFPLLAANVKVASTGQHFGKPYIIEKAGPVRVAFVGLCLVKDGDAASGGLKVADPVKTAAALVPELRKQADVVVAVTHLGLPEDDQLAAKTPGLDLVIGGHTHSVLDRGRAAKGPDGRPVLIVQAGENLQALGRVDLLLDKTAEGYRIVSAAASLIPIDATVKMDPTVTALLARWAEKIAPPAPKAEPAAKPKAAAAAK